MAIILSILNMILTGLVLILHLKWAPGGGVKLTEAQQEAVSLTQEALEKAWNQGVAEILAYDQAEARKAVRGDD